MMSRSSMLLALVLSAACLYKTSTAESCNLSCDNESFCVFGDTNFDAHQLPDGSYGFDRTASTNTITNINGMHCQCGPEWTGIRCEVPFDSCDGTDHICYNGGQCIPGLQDQYGNDHMFCDCNDAFDELGVHYVGKYCEEPGIDGCGNGHFCLNGGICNEQYPNFGAPCLCSDTFTGQHCEYAEELVPDCVMNCQNGGQCVLGSESVDIIEDMYNFFGAHYYEEDMLWEENNYCECVGEWDGAFCEIPKVPCGDEFCFHGGQCLERQVDGKTLHHCDCTESYTDEDSFAGRFCQYRAENYCSKNGGIEDHLFCVNGGTCKKDPYQGCDCPAGFSGFSCEFITDEFTGFEGDAEGEDKPNYDRNEDGIVDMMDPVEETSCSLECFNDGVCRNGVKEMSGLDGMGEITYHAPGLDEGYAEDEENLMHCVCREGFTGSYCQKEISVCGEGEHICLHGGKCVRDDQAHACDCDGTDSYVGDHCEHPVNDICNMDENAAGPGKPLFFCVNGGSCIDYVSRDSGHPGCTCPPGFSGPHCELKDGFVSQQQDEDDVVIGTDDGETAGVTVVDTDTKDGFEIVVLTMSVIAIAFVSLFGISIYCRQQRRKNDEMAQVLEFANRFGYDVGGYRDQPAQNIAPRRTSMSALSRETSKMHSSSRDPFATNLAPSVGRGGVDPLGGAAATSAPRVYIGPPRDEDGHELHPVQIL